MRGNRAFVPQRGLKPEHLLNSIVQRVMRRRARQRWPRRLGDAVNGASAPLLAMADKVPPVQPSGKVGENAVVEHSAEAPHAAVVGIVQVRMFGAEVKERKIRLRRFKRWWG